MYFIPVVTPMLVVAIMWNWIYQPDVGLLNQLIKGGARLVGLRAPKINWLKSVTLAMPSLILLNLWKSAGGTMVFYLAGLQAIPSMYYDAAKVDGATFLQQARQVTIPLVAPTTLFVLVTGTIGAMQMFIPVFIMTQGGPLGATQTIVYAIYRYAFGKYWFGMASALALTLFLILIVLSLVQLRLMRGSVRRST
jgi:multiple sugar transport system permease protein